jgi:hypothetical protein
MNFSGLIPMRGIIQVTLKNSSNNFLLLLVHNKRQRNILCLFILSFLDQPPGDSLIPTSSLTPSPIEQLTQSPIGTTTSCY